MHIHIFRTSCVDDDILNVVKSTLNIKNNNAIKVHIHEGLLDIKEGPHSEEYYLNYCDNLRNPENKISDIGHDEVLVLLTKQRNNHNHFNGIDFERKNCFVHTGDYEFLGLSNAGFPVAYLTIASAIVSHLDKKTALSLIREETTGTMMDFTRYKRDIIFKLKTADIDTNSIEKLVEFGVTLNEINCIFAIFENIRKQYLGNNKWYNAIEKDGRLVISQSEDKQIQIKVKNLNINLELQPKRMTIYLFLLYLPSRIMNTNKRNEGNFNELGNDIYEALPTRNRPRKWNDKWFIDNDDFIETVSYINKKIKKQLGDEIGEKYKISYSDKPAGYYLEIDRNLVENSITTDQNPLLISALERLKKI